MHSDYEPPAVVSEHSLGPALRNGDERHDRRVALCAVLVLVLGICAMLVIAFR